MIFAKLSDFRVARPTAAFRVASPQGTALAAGPATSRGGLRAAHRTLRVSPWDQPPFAEHPRRGRLVGDRAATCPRRGSRRDRGASCKDTSRRRLILYYDTFLALGLPVPRLHQFYGGTSGMRGLLKVLVRQTRVYYQLVNMVTNIPMDAAVIIPAAAQPIYRSGRELTRIPIILELLVSRTTRTIRGGASTPLSTAE